MEVELRLPWEIAGSVPAGEDYHDVTARTVLEEYYEAGDVY